MNWVNIFDSINSSEKQEIVFKLMSEKEFFRQKHWN